MTVDEISEKYRRRADLFEAKVTAVQPDQWSNQSPCDEWTARDVVGHIIDMHGVMLRPLGRALSPAPALADDPLGAPGKRRVPTLIGFLTIQSPLPGKWTRRWDG
ncbi:maleylpyruvate isomerase N-terminal domain-containing protein [Aeromicrobium sp.]